MSLHGIKTKQIYKNAADLQQNLKVNEQKYREKEVKLEEAKKHLIAHVRKLKQKHYKNNVVHKKTNLFCIKYSLILGETLLRERDVWLHKK